MLWLTCQADLLFSSYAENQKANKIDFVELSKVQILQSE